MKTPSSVMDPVSVFHYFDSLDSSPDGVKIHFKSSGSTGVEKIVHRDWQEFKSGFPQSPQMSGLVWATCFDLASYAGMGVAVQAWLGGGALICLKSPHMDECWDQCLQNQVTALSVTPTFFKLLAYLKPGSVHVADVPIRRVTFGGECVAGDEVSLCRSWWPESQIRVVYASAELGHIFIARNFSGTYSTGDLHNQWGGFEIRDGELFLRKSSNASDWVATGDLAEYVDGDARRVRLLGRATRVVNVGGHKFSLDHIEQCVEQCPGVAVAQCRAIANPITGQIVECQWQGTATESAVAQWCHANLPKPAWPRLWIHTPNITLKNGKKGFKVN